MQRYTTLDLQGFEGRYTCRGILLWIYQVSKGDTRAEVYYSGSTRFRKGIHVQRYTTLDLPGFEGIYTCTCRDILLWIYQVLKGDTRAEVYYSGSTRFLGRYTCRGILLWIYQVSKGDTRAEVYYPGSTRFRREIHVQRYTTLDLPGFEGKYTCRGILLWIYQVLKGDTRAEIYYSGSTRFRREIHVQRYTVYYSGSTRFRREIHVHVQRYTTLDLPGFEGRYTCRGILLWIYQVSKGDTRAEVYNS